MKVRSGFVSNSSSTSYVIAVTREFKATPEQIQAFYDRCNKYSEDDDVTDLDKAEKQMAEIVEVLCLNEDIWLGEAPSPNISNFVTACKDDVILTSLDGGPEDDTICNIFADKCKDKTIEKMKKLIGEQS